MFGVDLKPGLTEAFRPLELLALAILNCTSQLEKGSGLLEMLVPQCLIDNFQGLVFFVGLQAGVAGETPHDGVFFGVLSYGEQSLNGPVLPAFTEIDGCQHSLGLPRALEAALEQRAGSFEVSLHVLDGAQLGVDLGLQKELPTSEGARSLHDPLAVVDSLGFKLLAGKHHDDFHLATHASRQNDPCGDEENDGGNDPGGPRTKGLSEKKATGTNKCREDEGKHAARLTPKAQLDPSPIKA